MTDAPSPEQLPPPDGGRRPWLPLIWLGPESRPSRWGRYLTSGWRRPALTTLFVLLSLAVIARVIWGNWDLLSGYNWQLRPVYLLYALIFFGLDFFLALWAWHLLVARLANYHNLRQSIKIYLYANLARRIPGSVWYIASRALLYQAEGVSKTSTSLLSGLELAFFILSGVAATLLTLPFWQPALRSQSQISLLEQEPLLGVLLIPLALLLVHPRVLGWLWRKVSPEQDILALSWRDTILWLGVYILTWVLGGGVLFSIINLFYPLPLNHFIMIVGIWSLAGVVSLAGFITISIFGLREISLALLLTLVMPGPVALVIAVTIRLIWLSGELITSLLSLRL